MNNFLADDPAGFRRLALCALGAAAISAPILGAGVYSIAQYRAGLASAGAAFVEASNRWERLAQETAGPVVDLDAAVSGRDLFRSACAACHGMGGEGGLGKSIAQSDFVAGLDDTALRDFIAAGRPDAKPLPMPPKGGRDDLTLAQLEDITAYIRGLQDPRRMPALPEVAAAPAPTAEEKNAALAAAGGDEELAEYIASGAKLYAGSCIACHGPGGVGIKGNGKALAKSAFIADQDDDALLAFIARGRDPSDPKNTTGVGMPAKGGNPALSEDDLLDIIAYLRSLQDQQASTQ